MKAIFKFLLVFICINTTLIAQGNKTKMTLKFTEDTVSPKADLAAVAWIQGHWRGEAFGGYRRGNMESASW